MLIYECVSFSFVFITISTIINTNDYIFMRSDFLFFL